jgi:predicted dinucleotide-utilizing enzyme
MSKDKKKRIGLIGFGQIGSSLHEMITDQPELNMELAFIYEVNSERAAKIPGWLRLEAMERFASHKPDLVVEAAHPEAVRRYGTMVLKECDLMILSVSALVDAALENSMRSVCREKGTRLFIPHGAVLGLDGIKDGLSVWEQVTITMKKNPKNLNFDAAPDIRKDGITKETVLYDGPTRGVLPLFPKNVNSHATLALASLGMDKTRSILVADPKLEESVIVIDASGGGNSIHIERRNPIKGVTGKLTILSILESLKNILGSREGIMTC